MGLGLMRYDNDVKVIRQIGVNICRPLEGGEVDGRCRAEG